MTVRPITLMGNPVLMRASAAVADPCAPEIGQLIEDMKDSMAAAGGIGIAAPQIGVGLRVMMFYAPDNNDPGGDSTDRHHRAGIMEKPLTILINPELEILTDNMAEGYEGCLSVPGMRGLVPRYTHIKYKGFAPDGQLIERQATGFHAVVFQHEFDHLDGVLYPMRMTDIATLQYISEMQKLADLTPEQEMME